MVVEKVVILDGSKSVRVAEAFVKGGVKSEALNMVLSHSNYVRPDVSVRVGAVECHVEDDSFGWGRYQTNAAANAQWLRKQKVLPDRGLDAKDEISIEDVSQC